ncbi:hypothetical protein GT360_08550 [Vibrio astriarenae]|uniref:Uncharacterized protein n=1 Tax=Vibrio astriarenae TaxID=1481923 RepID=A0A7Z2T3N0_9VIBR|nr:hypothetical protein [Vibrio astriarenae]QIA63563.1 hypothetical protein GT360_08550 [Vibrio astriarenae]
MVGLSRKQKDELKSIGLDESQVQACSRVLTQIPSEMDLKAIKRLSKILNQAQSTFDHIREADPHFYGEIEQQLHKKMEWSDTLFSKISETLEDVHEQKQGVYVSELDLFTSKQVVRVTTPKSRDYRRYEALTNLWCSWGKAVKTSKESEFLSFLTICLKGGFSFDGVASVRTHFRRYFLGQTIDIASEGNKDDNLDMLGIEIKLKNGKARSAVLTVPKLNNLSKDIRKLMNKRS